ncbi:hypothetical protein R3P38DRAFT_3411610 [Favolaschia claudopus]|uniref:Uncharacterized protein n=1 Tax=Favolaschia claudopus TaxID=2862362 RepID=A0AAV9ZCP2_9AGAR
MFLSRVVQVHSPATACHAATEVFIIDEQIYKARSAVIDFDFSTTVIPAPSSLALPVSWVKYQVSAGDVQNPRMKSSLWTFGALPCTSHVPDSTSFRWLKQTWNTVLTRDGTLNVTVIDISSGEPTLPLPRVHELRARLTHPANLSNRLLVHASIDTEYQRLIEDECEDWIIAVFIQLMSQPLDQRYTLLAANMNYMQQHLNIEVAAFEKFPLAYGRFLLLISA